MNANMDLGIRVTQRLANIGFGIRATQNVVRLLPFQPQLAKFVAQERAIRAAEAERRAYAIEVSRSLTRQRCCRYHLSPPLRNYIQRREERYSSAS